jgi:hypothetical protein
VNYLFSQRLPPSGQETDRAGAIIYDCVNGLKCDILRSMDNHNTNKAETAWRLAVASWLQTNGFFIVSVNGKVSPTLYPILVS